MAFRGSLIALAVFLGCIAAASAQCIECNVSFWGSPAYAILFAYEHSLQPVPAYSTHKQHYLWERLRQHHHAAASCGSDSMISSDPPIYCCSTSAHADVSP